VTNNSGTVVYSAAYDPNGGIQKTWTSTYTPTLKFSGKERDGESGLDYFGARYYDKAQYRFISVDPIIDHVAALGDPKRWNLYAFCGGNPITYLDADGRTYLVINKARNSIGIFYGAWGLIGWFNASNNVWGNIKPWPSGAFPFIEWHPARKGTYLAWESIGPWGIWIFDVPGRSAMGFHSGRWGQTDDYEHYDWEYVTNGCIRGEWEAAGELFIAMSWGDSPTYLYVFDDLEVFFNSLALAASFPVGMAR
jgi:RHS repeat-associated protein